MKTLILSILTLVTTTILSSCTISCPDIGCVSAFMGGNITYKGFNLQAQDSIKYLKYPKGNFQTPVDSFYLRVELAQNTGSTPNNTTLSPKSSFDIAYDWILFMPSGDRYTLTDFRVFEKECAKCTNGYTYYDEYEVKVNGQLQTGDIVIIR